jgi:CheY-like chemotaxis protein
MSRLLDDLLDVSRITQGKIELRRDRVDLRQVLDNAMETMRGLIQEYGHSVEYERPGEALWLDGDPTRLEQVFNNLINNAVKYTEGAGTIRIGVAEETAPDREGKWAVIRVRDSGIGIDAGVLPHIFDLFVQADRSLDRTRGGLGLGLTLVDRLVRMHGGTVEARSEGLGHGSEFAVRLPLFATLPGGQASPPAELAAPALAEEPHDPSGDGKGCKVLVAEDNLDTASSMAELLEVWGYQVRVAYDGPMAIEMASLFAPEVVLLDIGLPHVDGYEVARRLHETVERAPMTIVALTGYSQDEDRKLAREAGCDHFLAKPVDLDALRAVLEQSQEAKPTQNLEPARE